MKKTQYCGLFSKEYIGTVHTVMGWVQNKRDMGGVIFLDLRDREGILQVVCNLAYLPHEMFHEAERVKNESVLRVTGKIYHREEETYNPALQTGEVELRADTLEVLSEADLLPFEIEDRAVVREDLRLKYRFLDLRRPSMYHNLKFRHKLVMKVNQYLDEHGFLSVETPMLTKSTPEGARDYLVPSRVHPGHFYALPQSPQIFKQLLMVGGVEKYYQISRCFRDEDLRADRQPEFTQVDMELSFVGQEEILQHLEELFCYLMKEMKGIDLPRPMQRMTWQQAMDRYGSDKPDLRFGLSIVDVTDIAERCGFTVFQGAVKRGGVVRAINVKGKADFSRSEIEALTQKALSFGAKGMAWIAVRENGELYSVLTKYFQREQMQELLARLDGQPGDFILFCADRVPVVRRTLGGLRLALADMLHLCREEDYRFLIVTDFPQFEYSEEEGRFLAMHHPFTMPYEEDLPYLKTDPARVRAQAYDVVLNGVELGSGSVRIHRRDVQERMFEALGFSQEEIQKRFGFFVNAFRYGTPPHGGFAFGLDRFVMLLCGASSLRDVIAFPKTKEAACLMTGAPDVVDREQLETLALSPGTVPDVGEIRRTQPQEQKTQIDVARIARLAMLSLTETEQRTMEQEMQKIVAFADTLSQYDTQDVPQTAHVQPMKNIWREDCREESFDRHALLSNVPAQRDGYVFVPKVVE